MNGIIIPIFMPHNSGGYRIQDLIAMLIVFNLVFISIYIYKIIKWKMDQNRNSFYIDVIMDGDSCFPTISINTGFFIIINGFALFMLLTVIVSKWL